MIDKHCPELLAAYAMGALDTVEHAEAEAHLRVCINCRVEAESLADALHATLGCNCPEAHPSPLARTQFLARLAVEITSEDKPSATAPEPKPEPMLVLEQPLPSTASSASRQPTSIAPRIVRQQYVPRWVMAAVAVPTVFAVALGFGLINMKQQYDNQSNHLLGQALSAPHVAMVLSGPAVKHGMTGEVIVPKTGSGGLLILSGLSKAPSKMDYTCWVRKNGQWTAWGPIRPDASGIAMFVMDRTMDPHTAATLGVTLEHMDRPITQPSQPMLLSTTL